MQDIRLLTCHDDTLRYRVPQTPVKLTLLHNPTLNPSSLATIDDLLHKLWLEKTQRFTLQTAEMDFRLQLSKFTTIEGWRV